jgi:hypothetical protein
MAQQQYVVVDNENGQAFGPFDSRADAVAGILEAMIEFGEITQAEYDEDWHMVETEQCVQDLMAFGVFVYPLV